MNNKPIQITVEPDGTIRFIHDDALAGLIEEARSVNLRRASHVEPTADGQWTADLSPVQGPVLGPFKLRKEALAAEVRWLVDNVL